MIRTKVKKQHIFNTGSSKLLLFSKEIEDWKKSKPVSPIALEVEPCSICNDNCPGCQGRMGKTNIQFDKLTSNGNFLSLDLISEIVNSPLAPKSIILSGDTGEPLLHPRISEMIDIISPKIPYIIITNGLVMTDKLCTQIIQSCQGIRISLDSHDAKSRLSSHGTPIERWSQLISNIKKLVSAKKKNSLSKCQIGVGYLTGPGTVKGIRQATKLAKKLGVDYIQFRPFHYDETVIDFNPLISKYQTNKFQIYTSDQKYAHFGVTREYDRCYAANFFAVINPLGELSICCHHVSQKNATYGVLGSHDLPTWEAFINSPIRKMLIESYSVAKCIPRCRLDRQNCVLNQIKNTNVVPHKPRLDASVIEHSVFL